jgi:hypothetical protein
VLVAYQIPGAEPLTLNVELGNAAGVPDRLVGAAQKEASRIFSASRVHLGWIQKPERDSSAPLRVLITTDEFSSNNTRGVLGSWGMRRARVASAEMLPPCLPECPACNVHVSGFRAAGARSRDAHELAHLLLPRGWHDGHGVMRQAWDSTDFQLLSLRQLGFAAVPASLLRAAVERTMHTSADLPTGAGATANDPRRNEP